MLSICEQANRTCMALYAALHLRCFCELWQLEQFKRGPWPTIFWFPSWFPVRLFRWRSGISAQSFAILLSLPTSFGTLLRVMVTSQVVLKRPHIISALVILSTGGSKNLWVMISAILEVVYGEKRSVRQLKSQRAMGFLTVREAFFGRGLFSLGSFRQEEPEEERHTILPMNEVRTCPLVPAFRIT